MLRLAEPVAGVRPTVEGARVIALPHLDIGRRDHMLARPGMTVAEIVTMALPGATDSDLRMVRVTIGGHVVTPAHWARVRPKVGATVLVRLVPAGGSLRSILALVVTIAAIVIAPYAVAAFGFAVTATSTAIATAAIATAGSLLVSALVPLKPPGAAGGEQASPTYSINGFQNPASPGGVIPNVLGKHRFAPPYAVMPYTEIADDDQYVLAVFNFGYGPVLIENIRLGETAISAYTDVTYEVRQGFDTDEPLTLITEQVIEDSTSTETEDTPEEGDGSAPGVEAIRTTARDTTDVSIDITFPEGLAHYNDDGDPEDLTVDIQIRYRLLGEEDFITETTLNITRAERDVVRVSYRWTLPAPGQYEIGVKRLTDGFVDVQNRGRSFWSALRSHRPGYPINFDVPLALVAVRIKAGGQINGVVSSLSADVTRICPDWDSGTQTWVTRPTRRPASLFRYVLQGSANAFPKTDAEINLSDLQAWHDHNVAQGLNYDRVHDYEASLWDVLRDVAAAGRATPRDAGAQWTVAVDRPQSLVVGHISPRNSWGFQGERSYVQAPEGFRVTFRDETNGYLPTERVIPWPTFGGDEDDVEIAEEISLPGLTNPAQVFREARRKQYELIHRADRYTVNQDIEGLVLTRGDLAVLNHDVLDRVQAAARVKAVDGDVVVLDALVTIEAGETYGCRFRASNGTSTLRAVVNAPGETAVLMTLGAGTAPAVGDLALFGRIGQESLQVVVKEVEITDNLNCRLTLIDHAPQIETLANADDLPEWAEPVAPDAVSQGRPVDAGSGALGFVGTKDISTTYAINAVGMGAPESGDLIIAFVRVARLAGSVTLTPPAGWTQLFNLSLGGGVQRVAAYYIEYGTGSPHGNFVASDDVVWAVNVYRIPQWQGAPEAATATGTSTSADPPNLTPSWGSAATLWLTAAGYSASSSTPASVPTGYESRLFAKIASVVPSVMTSARRSLTGASENPAAWGLPSSSEWAAATVAIRPPA